MSWATLDDRGRAEHLPCFMMDLVILCGLPRARGDQHVTGSLPVLIKRYEQEAGQRVVQSLVVDREGMAAEFLAGLRIGRANSYLCSANRSIRWTRLLHGHWSICRS
jgi:hypothetical protein